MSAIVTVTLNPAIDLTVALDHLTPGEVHRAHSAVSNAGGKGVNVAACLADWGVNVSATGFLGAGNVHPFETLFRDKSVGDGFIRLPGETRINVKITEPGGRTTDVNLPGLPIEADLLPRLNDRIRALEPSLLVLSGSLPAGLSPSIWADMASHWQQQGVRVLLDVSGAPLQEALSREELLFAVKPNRDELAAVMGAIPDDAALLAQARALHRNGIGLVVVSLGSEGALFVSEEGALYAAPLKVGVVSSVGAGDAMVAGLCAGISEDASLERLARLSTAFAAGKLRKIGPHLPPKQDVEALASAVSIAAAEDWIMYGRLSGEQSS
ncbi:1-phosphofructokinase [Rhizomicrobium palustre]|uniref:Phosphofructokinase n=1 Tax=Rhizomicrobium palustre TaxID=189966 RepID=A0A846N2T1_9PROT|nr:1-phosphofructokinase [Rhizomicrobium palustre]NIK89532.1 1-phosphofructokinase [Rhizomicrobium palustre]